MPENEGNHQVKTLTGCLLTTLLLVSLFAESLAQTGLTPTAAEEFARLQDGLRASRASGDNAAYLKGSEDLYRFLNGSPRATLQLMSAEAGAGKPDEALSHFSQYVDMGQSSEETLQAKSFDSLRNLPKYKSIRAGMTANGTAIADSEEAFRLQAAARVPEDIDYDPAAKAFYVTTVLGRQILRIDSAGHSTLFANSPDHWPMMALKIDARRRMLWATEVAVNGFASVQKGDWGRSVVLLYDLRSARLLQRIEGPDKAALGDMTLDSNGNAIVADGEQGGIYRIGRVTLKPERIDAGDFISPQTPAMLPDGRNVLIPDYVRGIGVLNLDSKAVAWFQTEGRHATTGIDGLYTLGDSLIATQNGASPERVVRFKIDASRTHVIAATIIERATPTLGDPTHGVIVGEYFYYIANSGWDTLDEHGNVPAGKNLPRSSIRRAKIG
jgi:sugar lactone lactonase YvrE